jgi:hypothetical protein
MEQGKSASQISRSDLYEQILAPQKREEYMKYRVCR